MSNEMKVHVSPCTGDRGPGIKLDEGKPLLWAEVLVQFGEALTEVARVGEQGSRAPGHVRGGWRTVPEGYARYSEAILRHLEHEARLFRSSENLDHEQLIHACATVAWNALARLHHLLQDAQE